MVQVLLLASGIEDRTNFKLIVLHHRSTMTGAVLIGIMLLLLSANNGRLLLVGFAASLVLSSGI